MPRLMKTYVLLLSAFDFSVAPSALADFASWEDPEHRPRERRRIQQYLITERQAGGGRHRQHEADGKQLGRPKRMFRRDEAMRLRAAGMSWRKVAAELDVPVTTVVEACR